MASKCFWAALYALLPLVIAQGIQYDHPLPVPEIMGVKSEGDWKMHTEWVDNFMNSNKPEKVTYDVEIFHTEQMRLVHNETIEMKPHLTGINHWTWTSPLPLQCTSHSVRLRYRDHSQTSDWTPLYTLEGTDLKETKVYPIDYVARVGDSIIFCCVLKTESIAGFISPDFKIRISNRTFITEPVRQNKPSETAGNNLPCDNTGVTYFAGYEPDDQNLTCETRDLSSVECHWSPGRFVGEANYYTVHYSINGWDCLRQNKDLCVLDEDINKGKTTWTLTAKNKLGEKNISDTADLKYRVRLRAPKLAHAALVNARNATLEWKWNKDVLNSFPMICQVQLNGHIIKETFDGIGLESVLLADLLPFMNYTARVRCGSREYFYKWGDWSNLIRFTTEEDVPEAIDVWMQVLDEHTYVMWKHPIVSQSHGIIKGYELLVRSPSNMTREPISKATNEYCHRLSPRNAEPDNVISVSARNSKYVSPPSNITIPSLGSDSGIITTPISGNGSVFSVSWEPSPVSSCGYVVDWFPTYREEKCSVKWMKTNVPYATVDSDLENGVKYTLSVYACTSGAPQLLQRRTGYVKELPPSEMVQSLKADPQGSDVVLSWEKVPEEQQNGVILGYKVYYREHSSVNKNNTSVQVTSELVTLTNLRPGEYTFKVKAFTSAGEGPDFVITHNIGVNVYRMIVSILTALGTVAFIITLIAVCSTNRKWLRSKLYPDIPKPELSQGWFTKGSQLYLVIDKVLLSEKEVLMGKNPQVGLQVVPLKRQKDPEDVELMSSDPSRTVFSYNPHDSKTASLILLDSSYIDVPIPGIQNPTYNLLLSEPAKADVALAYHPQIQNLNTQVQTCDVVPVEMDCDYQPQSAVSNQIPGVANTHNPDAALNSTLVNCPEYQRYSYCS